VVDHDDKEPPAHSDEIQGANRIVIAGQGAAQEDTAAKGDLQSGTEELARALSMMRATLESTTDGILVIDEARKVTGFNENFVRMWNISKEVMALQDIAPLTEIMSAQCKDAARFLARETEIGVSSPPESYDLLELANGRFFERCSRIQFVDEQKAGRVWSFRDITERRRAEDALRDEIRILELVNKTGATLASKLEMRALVQAVTDAATELSGAKFGAFFYNTVKREGDTFMLYALAGAPREAFEKFGQPRATALFGPTFNGDAPIRCDDVRDDPRYGKMAPHRGLPEGHLPVRSYLAVPVISRDGDVMGGLFFGHPEPGVFTERTERIIVGIAAQVASAMDNARLYEATQEAAKEREVLLASERSARAEAERMSELKDEFLSTLSHELRTPLNSILGWSQILRRGNRNEADLLKGLDTIERNVRVQAQLIEDLLDMSRITSGKMRLNIQQTDPISFIVAALETVRPAANAKGIRLETMLDPAAGPVSGDPNRLQQVIWNLLSNAIKFTPKEGKVQVLLERVNSHIEISIADTGVGIKPEFLTQVFERFRQADGSATRRYGGLGLGLAIVKHLVELHGGTVGVKSAGEGSGASFSVNLPLTAVYRNTHDEARSHSKSPKAIPAEFTAIDLRGVKVLVVDDEADARELLKRVLAECEAEVFTAASAAEAVQLLESERPQVLVSDIGMPDVDGFELLRRVRALGPASGGMTPAIALTAFARSEDRTRALRAGFLVHISKPVEPSELIATVASVVGRSG
jgi:signal transduction histidine kinase/CheY-like chemotaxis protein